MKHYTLHWSECCAGTCPNLVCVCPDDTPVASAKAGPSDGLGDADDEGGVNNGRLWRTVLIGEQEHRIDMQVIKPYLRVITHGGQCQDRNQPGSLSATLNIAPCCFYSAWPQHDSLLTETVSHQVIMAKVLMPSLFSLPVTCLTAALQTTTTSWKTSSCECQG